MMNKTGGFTDILLFVIITFTIVVISGVFIYLGGTVQDKLHETMDDMDIGGTVNATEQIDSSIGAVNNAYAGLYWISV